MECLLQAAGAPGVAGERPEESGCAGTRGKCGHGYKAWGALPAGAEGLVLSLKSPNRVCRC